MDPAYKLNETISLVYRVILSLMCGSYRVLAQSTTLFPSSRQRWSQRVCPLAPGTKLISIFSLLVVYIDGWFWWFVVIGRSWRRIWSWRRANPMPYILQRQFPMLIRRWICRMCCYYPSPSIAGACVCVSAPLLHIQPCSQHTPPWHDPILYQHASSWRVVLEG